MRTREEHLKWCKERALELVDGGDPKGGITSMFSDLGKHEETAQVAKDMALIAGFELMNATPESARRFIEGFN